MVNNINYTTYMESFCFYLIMKQLRLIKKLLLNLFRRRKKLFISNGGRFLPDDIPSSM